MWQFCTETVLMQYKRNEGKQLVLYLQQSPEIISGRGK